MSTEELAVVSNFGLQHTTPVQSAGAPIDDLKTWLAEPDTIDGLQRCADTAIERIWSDAVIRIPRNHADRENNFSKWLQGWRDRIGPELEESFRQEFNSTAANLPGNYIKDVVTQIVWPRIESTLLSYALRGLAKSWASRNMGDLITIGDPELHLDTWVLPLGLINQSKRLGVITLDRDGNVIPEQSSTRVDILAQFTAFPNELS